MALLDSFSTFLRSPEAMGLAQGLLQGAAPNMHNPTSFGGALGLGFQHANKAREDEEKRKLAREVFGIQKATFELERQKALRDVQKENEIRQLLFGGKGIGGVVPDIGDVTDVVGAADKEIGKVTGAFENPESNIPSTQRQAAYSVKDARINGGQESYIPSHDESGNYLTKEQAIEHAIQNPNKVIGSGSGLLMDGNTQPSPEVNQEANQGGLLGGLDAAQADYAKKAYLLGGNAGLLNALKPSTPPKPTKEEQLVSKGLPTAATITKAQQSIKSIDKLIPDLKGMLTKDIPKQVPNILPSFLSEGHYSYFQPEKQASYLGDISAAVDTYVKAFDLPNTNESLHLAENILMRKPLEGEKAYKKRLAHEIKKLEDRRKYLVKSISTPGIPEAPTIEQNDPLGIR